MAAFNFTYELSGSNQLLTQVSLPPPISGGTTVITNTLDSANHNFGYSWVIAITGGGTLTAHPSDLGYTGTFASGVYRCVVTLTTLVGTDTGTQYLLDTTVIDAAIAAYTPTSPVEAANLVWMQDMRAQITTYATDLATNYAVINTLIGIIQDTLVSPQTITTSTVLTLPSNDVLTVVAQNTNEFIVPLNAPSNYVENTLTGDYGSFTNDFLVADAEGTASADSADVFALPIYADGVAIMYNFAGNNFAEGTIRLAQYKGYYVVTTTIANQFLIFEANYDPNNAAQAASYQSMLTSFAAITTLSADIPTNLDDINSEITSIQSQLALFVDLGLTLELTSSNTLKTTITSTIPNVTYSDQSLVLTNMATLVEYSTDTFPDTYVDTTKNITSATFDNSTTYADSVYQVEVSWTSANNMEFAGNAYALVTTAIDCGIVKYGISNGVIKCNTASIEKLDLMLMYRDFIDKCFKYGNYEACIEYINVISAMLAESNCLC